MTNIWQAFFGTALKLIFTRLWTLLIGLVVGSTAAAILISEADTALAAGLPPHGATFPLPMAEMLVAFLTEQGQLVVDQMAGTLTVPEACENLGRRWAASDLHGENIGIGVLGFPDAKVSPAFLQWLNERRAGAQI